MGSCRQEGNQTTLGGGTTKKKEQKLSNMRMLTLLFLVYMTQAARMRRQSLIDRIRAQARGQPVECQACTERARETPNMACCRCQDEEAFCNNKLGQPALLPIEDFPVRRNTLGPGLTCQNNVECTLFDDCAEDAGACRIGDNLVEDDISLRQAGQEQGCSRGQV